MSKRRKFKLATHKARLVGPVEPAEIKHALGDDGQETGPPTFSAAAYSGGLVPGYTATPSLPHPYVIDLAGTTKARTNHANLNHKSDQLVGHLTTVENDGKRLYVEGALSAPTPHRDLVAQMSKAGAGWEVSIEGNLGGRRFVPAGQTEVVNGQTLQGPFFRMTKNVFTDIAFVSHGADGGNAVTVAASTAGEVEMNEFEQFIVSCGANPEEITAEHRATLKKAFDALKGSHSTGNGAGKPDFAAAAADVRREHERQDTIQKMALAAMQEYPMHHEQIQNLATAAIASKTEPRDFELELLRGTRIQAGVFINHSKSDNDPKTIECAIAMSAGLPKIEEHYSEEVLNSVDRSGMRNFGLQQLLMRVATANGYVCRAGDRVHQGNMREVLEYCFPPAMQRARLSGFSAVSLPNILGNVANKEILAGYMEEDSTWQEIATVKPVNNFHAVTSYRMLDSLEYEEVGPTGEIKHGTLSEESYTRQAKTYAKMLGLTRTDIINDDLGAFDDIRTRLGMGAAKKFNNIFWAAFMNNASFFTAALTNYIEGATTNLGTDGVGLGLGVTAYRQMNTPTADGSKRIGVSAGRPQILLAPPELEVAARKLFISTNFITGASATTTEANIFAGLYRPVIQDRLSDSAFTGNSATQWFLFGTTLRPMVVSFLNGNRTPTIESTDADFNVLGIQFRGFHDFGCDKSEYLAGIKSKGAA